MEVLNGDTVDVTTARVLHREFSHGVIAPGYDDDALAILRRKMSGTYKVLRIQPNYEPSDTEIREVFGLTFSQKRNCLAIDTATLSPYVCGAEASPAVLALPFRENLRRPERDNAAEQYLRSDLTDAEKRLLPLNFVGHVHPLATRR